MTEKHLLFVFFIFQYLSLVNPEADIPKENKHSEKLPPCQACKNVVQSFQKGIDKTSRGKYDGGDADWEERKLGSYANSEIRLVEILEDLCKDVDKGRDQCHTFVEDNEEILEKWWLHEQKSNPNLFTYICINSIKVCCHENTYGADCTPCPGGVERPCSGNGKCRGAGTRKGSGTCQCNSGYGGNICDECATSYYQSYKDEDKLICSECHKSCDGCDGDGPDMCKKCKKGYILQDELCVDTESLNRSWKIRMVRYITYLGLCVATFIIFKKNVFLASIIGTAIAIYIAVSEYTVTDEEMKVVPKFI